MFTRRRTDLASERMECVWVEINDLKSPSLLVGYIYRNPASLTTWFDQFVQMIDKAYDYKSNFLLLGDFNIDLWEPQSTWDNSTSLVGFHQLVQSATKITSTTATLIDHICTDNRAMVSDVLVSTVSISDHSPVFCTWSFKPSKYLSKSHKSIKYRSFRNFDNEHSTFWQCL